MINLDEQHRVVLAGSDGAVYVPSNTRQGLTYTVYLRRAQGQYRPHTCSCPRGRLGFARCSHRDTARRILSQRHAAAIKLLKELEPAVRLANLSKPQLVASINKRKRAADGDLFRAVVQLEIDFAHYLGIRRIDP